MTSTGAMSRLLQTLTPRPTTPRPQTPDLTSLNISDVDCALSTSVAPPLIRSYTTRPAAPDEPSGLIAIGLSGQVVAPKRPPPPPPVLRPLVKDTGADSQLQASLLSPIRPVAARERPSMLSPISSPHALLPHEPIRSICSAHQWLARYLLDEPAPYGPAQLLADDMLGAGILGASATGARPLVAAQTPLHQRPFDHFKAFVERLGTWVDEAPAGKRAMYQVFAIKTGRVRMHYMRTLEVACLGVESFPDVLGECTHLQKIDARRNCIKDLPHSLCNLHALRDLNLEDNLFTRMPDVIRHLSLDVLHLDVAPEPIVASRRPFVDRQGQPGWL